MIVGYCRAGKLRAAASLAAQQRHLAAAGAEKFFCERASIFGDSPELERAIEFSQKGDVIAITKSYRVARTSRGVLALIRRLGSPIDTSTTTGRMILGSAPLWSLGMSPLRSALRDLAFGWSRLR
jgi:DNA invertase Pin-like site-specific DNA recombinase